MAYYSSTEASSISNPPVRIGGPIGGNLNTTSTGGAGGQMWIYNSSNGTTDTLVSNFFTDAQALGMRKGDLVFCVGCTGSTVNIVMGVLGTVSTLGACIGSTGSFISSTFG